MGYFKDPIITGILVMVRLYSKDKGAIKFSPAIPPSIAPCRLLDCLKPQVSIVQ